MPLTDCRELPLSTDSRAAIDGLEEAHGDLLRMRGDPVSRIDAVLRDYPSFVMGHVFKAAVLTQAMETRIYNDMLGAVEKAETLWPFANDRERGHIKAVRAWVDGNFIGAVFMSPGGLPGHMKQLYIHAPDISFVIFGSISPSEFGSSVFADNFCATVQAVPETPGATLWLLSLGLASAGVIAWRRRKPLVA